MSSSGRLSAEMMMMIILLLSILTYIGMYDICMFIHYLVSITRVLKDTWAG
jgi:hypothetical protein